MRLGLGGDFVEPVHDRVVGDVAVPCEVQETHEVDDTAFALVVFVDEPVLDVVDNREAHAAGDLEPVDGVAVATVEGVDALGIHVGEDADSVECAELRCLLLCHD